MEFSGKSVLVTGAQQGIGEAMAVAFAAAGADVAVNWHDDRSKAEAVCQAVRGYGRKAIAVEGDVGNVPACHAIVEETVREFGGIDILVNNAGMFPRCEFLEMDQSTYDFVMNINQRGTFFCSQAAARAMFDAGHGGCIVNISSRSIEGRTPMAAHYTASKMAIVGTTRAIASELAKHGIRVNAIAPGLTDTAQPRYGHSEDDLQRLGRETPLGRMIRPDEIADLAIFLCSDRARMITGQVYHVNGGSYFA